MRAIDADALTSKIQKQYCEDCNRRKGENNGKRYMAYEIGDAPCRACGIDDMYAELDDAPTIQPEPHWIPVTERLPEKFDYYLVSGINSVWFARYESGRFLGILSGHALDTVIAWMPLPEPYKGVTE